MDRYQRGPPLFCSSDGSYMECICLRLSDQCSVFVRMRVHPSREKAEEYAKLHTADRALEGVPGLRQVHECVLEGLSTFVVEEGGCQSLSWWITQHQRPLREDEFWQLRESVLTTVKGAHAVAIAHGGLMPSTVYLSQGKWKVGGFLETLWLWRSGSEKLISVYSCPELKTGKEPSDWYQADLYSLGLILLYSVTGNIPHFISPDSQQASQQVYEAVAAAHLSVAVAASICSLMFPPAPVQPEESVVMTEVPVEIFVCSFCTEETGTVTPEGTYACLNPKCEKYVGSAAVPVLTAPLLQPSLPDLPSQPAIKLESEHVQQQVEASRAPAVPQPLVNPSPAENPVEPPPSNICIICNKRYVMKPTRWVKLIRQVPAAIVSDICSLSCFERYCRDFAIPNETKSRCMECFGLVPPQSSESRRLTCSPDHYFCSERCWTLNSRVRFTCPRCCQILNIVQVDRKGCCCCGGKEGLQTLTCGHGSCLKCLSMFDFLGAMKCMKAGCGHFEIVS